MLDYKIEHLSGRPQGPPFTSPSGPVLGVLAVLGVSAAAGFGVAVVAWVLFDSAFFSPLAAPSEGPCSQAKLTLEIAWPKDSP